MDRTSSSTRAKSDSPRAPSRASAAAASGVPSTYAGNRCGRGRAGIGRDRCSTRASVRDDAGRPSKRRRRLRARLGLHTVERAAGRGSAARLPARRDREGGDVRVSPGARAARGGVRRRERRRGVLRGAGERAPAAAAVRGPGVRTRGRDRPRARRVHPRRARVRALSPHGRAPVPEDMTARLPRGEHARRPWQPRRMPPERGHVPPRHDVGPARAPAVSPLRRPCEPGAVRSQLVRPRSSLAPPGSDHPDDRRRPLGPGDAWP